ncbi:MAG: trimethylamine methyltransferase family protein [Kiloniellales bacterium]|nr:trimethylamine methyltransferase family protein [Kiloniellales bacterium]
MNPESPFVHHSRPWQELENPLQPIEVLTHDQVETIHKASLKVLKQYGIKVLGPRARDLYRKSGATVNEDTMIVRFDPAFIEERVATSPSRFRVHARNPSKSVTLGDRKICFAPVGGPSFVSDLDKGRRSGTFEELKDFIRLVHMLEVIHIGGTGCFAPLDLPVPTRHLDQGLAGLTLTDRVTSCSLLGGQRPRDAIEMAAIARGLAVADLLDYPVLYGVINTNSPRQLDNSMSEGLIAMAEMGQPVVVTPFTLLGAMAPATLAGALVQQNAEALAGIALIQIVRPGAPAIYGGFTSNVDMKSGAPAFGTPEYAKACQAGGQMARFYGIPYRSSNTNASNCVDAQAGYESVMSLWGAVMGHANLVLHGAGWLEGGLTASFEKLIIDAEILETMAAYLSACGRPDHDVLTPEAIYETFLPSLESCSSNPIAIKEIRQGAVQNAADRAHKTWKSLLQRYEAPQMDPSVREALEAFIERRRKQIESDGEIE